jgi:hypothetical protein
MGGYTSKEITEPSYQGTTNDEINLVSYNIHPASPGVVGRCFIEVDFWEIFLSMKIFAVPLNRILLKSVLYLTFTNIMNR